MKLKLPWFSYIEPITKLDEIFHLDHVSAHRILNSKNLSNKPLCNKNINSLSGLRSANPLPSKKFRVEEVIKILTKKFVQSWEDGKSSSSKLSFYNIIKQKFAREPYLDCSKGFSRRYFHNSAENKCSWFKYWKGALLKHTSWSKGLSLV